MNSSRDILPAVNDGASHTAGPWFGSLFGFTHRRGAGSATPPLLLSVANAAESEVPCCVASVSDVSRWGTIEPQSGNPNLSDCLDMNADIPHRMNRYAPVEHLKPPIWAFQNRPAIHARRERRDSLAYEDR